VYDAIIDRVPIGEVIVATAIDGLDLVPSTPALSGAEVELVGIAARERRLAASLAGLDGRYERVLIDCPPSLGLLTVNALTAADGVLIPIQTEYYALEGLSQLVNTIRLVRESLNPRLEVEGVLLTMYDARTNLSAQVAAEVRRHMDGTVFETVVPRSVRLSEAPSHGLPVALYAPASRGAQAYDALAAEVAARG
jgi:chromosome partitioning protein